ncbi:hypothetical protein ABID58_003667 [Bradyrhizobium sp. S3.2.6]
MECNAIRDSHRDESAPDYAALRPGYNSEAAPLPKGCHFSLAGELAAFGLLKAFNNRGPMLSRDLEDLSLVAPFLFGSVWHRPYPRCFRKNSVALPQASSAASRSCTAWRCSLTKACSAS